MIFRKAVLNQKVFVASVADRVKSQKQAPRLAATKLNREPETAVLVGMKTHR